MIQVYLIGSGPFDETNFKRFVADNKHTDKEEVFVGIDLGAQRLLDAGYPIDLAVGDFDSVTTDKLAVIKENAAECIQLQAMKDDTDTEIAFSEAAQRWPEATYYYFGGLGGRLDHTLSNVWLVLQPRYQSIIENIYFVSENDLLQFLLPGNHKIYKYHDMTYLSFIALTKVKELSLSNVVYSLDNYDMKIPLALISNEFKSTKTEMTCHFSEGILLAIQTQDKKH